MRVLEKSISVEFITVLEAEGSLLCLEEPAKGPCPKSHKFSPHVHTLHISISFSFILVLMSGLFFSGFCD